MGGNVIVGTDGSACADVAVERAARVARLFGVGLSAVHAYAADEAIPSPASLGGGGDARRAGRTILDAVRARYEDLDITTVLRGEDPSDVLADVARRSQAHLAVVGNRGVGSVRQRLLGAVPHRLLHRAVTDVLVVHSTDGHIDAAVSAAMDVEDYGRILVAVKAGPSWRQVVGRAARLAALCDASLEIITADSDPARGAQTTAEAAGQARALHGEVTTAVLAARDDGAGEAIVGHASEVGADLLVVGSSGVPTAPRLLGASVAEAITLNAPCDVLIARTTD